MPKKQPHIKKPIVVVDFPRGFQPSRSPQAVAITASLPKGVNFCPRKLAELNGRYGGNLSLHLDDPRNPRIVRTVERPKSAKNVLVHAKHLKRNIGALFEPQVAVQLLQPTQA